MSKPASSGSSLTLSIMTLAVAILALVIMTDRLPAIGNWLNRVSTPAPPALPMPASMPPSPLPQAQAMASASPGLFTILPETGEAPPPASPAPSPSAQGNCTAPERSFGPGAHLYRQPAGCTRLRVTLGSAHGAMIMGLTLSDIREGMSFSILVDHEDSRETRLQVTGDPEPVAWQGENGGGVHPDRGIGFTRDEQVSFTPASPPLISQAILQPLP